MAGEMGKNPREEFSSVISTVKILSLWWRLWCPSTAQVSCSKLEEAWSCSSNTDFLLTNPFLGSNLEYFAASA